MSILSRDMSKNVPDLTVTLVYDLERPNFNYLKPVLSATELHQLDHSMSIFSQVWGKKRCSLISVWLDHCLQNIINCRLVQNSFLEFSQVLLCNFVKKQTNPPTTRHRKHKPLYFHWWR